MGDLPFNRPAPSASGTFEKTPLVHLVLYALQNGLTGTLEVAAPDERRAAFLFLSGQPGKAYTSELILNLGSVMHELGYLSSERLASSIEELADAKSRGPALHGQLLLASGAIDSETLIRSLREQVALKLRHVSGFPPQSTYAYYNLFDGLRGWGMQMDEGFDPVPMIGPMLQANPPTAHIEQALAGITNCPIRLNRNANLARLGLTPSELAVVDRLGQSSSKLNEIITSSGLAEADCRLLLYLLLVTRQIDVVRTSEVRGSGSYPAIRPSPFPRPPAASKSATHAILPPRRDPSQHGIPAPVISSPTAHAREPSQRGVPAPVISSSPPASPLATPSPPKASPSLPPELARRWEEIVRRAAALDQVDYFTILDIRRDATTEQAQASFFALAKKWHPDRLPSELAPVRDACSRVFGRMSEAHATLSDRAKRETYLISLTEGQDSPEARETVAKVIDAATSFQKAEVCLRRGDYVQAEALCQGALDADRTQPEYIAMMGWLQSLKPENQPAEKASKCIAMLSEAININPRCEMAYFWRGMIFRRLGKIEAAVRDFKEAVDLNPRNIDAAREVRLYRMRVGRSSTKPPHKSHSGAAPRRSSPLPAKVNEDKPRLLDRLFKKPS